MRWWGAKIHKYSETKKLLHFQFILSDLKKNLDIKKLKILWHDFGAPLQAAPGGSCPPPAPSLRHWLHTNTTPTVITHSCVLLKPPSYNDNGYKFEFKICRPNGHVSKILAKKSEMLKL